MLEKAFVEEEEPSPTKSKKWVGPTKRKNKRGFSPPEDKSEKRREIVSPPGKQRKKKRPP